MARNSYKARPRRGLGGFTLVELVVVIAVLAILAGVGAVAYNGYIEYAKKGQDRATVGEIMHALELADYTDPLGYTEVYFTSNGGIQVPVDVSGKVTKALEDAFGGEGALASVKPSYEDWKEQEKTFDLVGIKAIISRINSGDLSGITGLTNYIDAVSGGGAASFSQDIDELWGTVGTFVDLVQSGKLEGVPSTENAITKAINYCNDNSEFIINTWTTKNTFITGSSGEATQVELTAQVARNYAFASYAAGHPLLTDEMRTQLKEYKTPLQETPTGDTKISTIVMEPYYNANSYLTGGNWKTIIDQYISSGQARIDALAYCGMMDVASKIPDIIQATSDTELLNTFGNYTDELGTILGDPSIIDYVQNSSSLDSIEVSGKGICIKVTKLGGQLSFTVDPPEANPRGNGASVSTGGSEGGSCELNHTSSMSVAIGLNSTMDGMEMTTDTETIEICTKGGQKTCTITFTPGAGLDSVLNNISVVDTSASGNVEIKKYDVTGTVKTTETWIITAKKATETPITLTMKVTVPGLSTEKTISVTVH